MKKTTSGGLRIAARSLVVLAVALLALGCRSSSQRELEKAKTLLRQGSPAKAVPILRTVLDREPDNAEANYLLGSSLAGLREMPQAMWPLRRAADSDSPYAAQAGVMLASIMLATDDTTEALKVVNQALDKQPDLLTGLAIRANIQLKRNMPKEALADANRMIELDPSAYPAWLARTTALNDLKRYKEAGESVRKMYQVAVKTYPAQAPLACAAIAEYLDQRALDRPAATKQAEKCVSLYPGSVYPLRTLIFLYDAVGKRDQATQKIVEALKVSPTNEELLDDLIGRLSDPKDYDKLQAILIEAAKKAKTPLNWKKLAEVRRDHGDYDQALDALGHALKLAANVPARDELEYMRAEVLALKGDEAKALDLAKKLHNPAYRGLLRARVYAAKGEPRKALAAVEASFSAWPNNYAARVFAAQLCEHLGEWERAVMHYREAANAGKAKTDAAMMAARIQDTLGNYKDASTLLAFHAKYRPPTPEFFALAGDITLHLNQPKLASEYYRRAALLDAVIGYSAVKRAEKGPEAALAFLDSKVVPKALRSNARFLEAYADDAQAAKQPGRALDAVNEAIQASPKPDPALLTLRGSILLSEGKKSEAQAAYAAALKADSGWGDAFEGEGRILQMEGHTKEALKRYDAGLTAAHPSYLAGYKAGRIAFDSGDRKGAERRWREVVKRAPGLGAADNDLAWLLAEEDVDLPLAHHLATRAIHLRADDPEAWDTMGAVLLRQGSAEGAARALKKSLELQPGAPDVQYRLAVALSKMGHDQEAREVLQKALATGKFKNESEARALAGRLAQEQTGR